MKTHILVATGVALFAFVLACGGGGGSGGNDDPADVVAEFYQRVGQLDESGMAQLVCPESRAGVEDIPLLGRYFVIVPELADQIDDLGLKDFETVMVESDESSATVAVSGRLVALNETPLDDGVVLRRTDEGQWCIVDFVSESDAEPPFSEAAQAEADSDPSLPGEHVDLAEIYLVGPYPRTDGHVSEDIDYEAASSGSPPAGGPHWGSSACDVTPTDSPPFCGPAPWGIFTDPWPAATLVHNMEHGGVVVWYNTTDQAVIDDLTDLVIEHMERRLIVLSPYPDMEEGFVAITSWSRRLLVPAGDYDRDLFAEFIEVHERRFNPENF